jgi:rhomboid family GlyGly-CTERM serine protease
MTWLVPSVLAIVCAVLACEPAWRDGLDYRREAIAHGALWRLASAHLVHLSTAHAALDIAAMLLVAWVFGRTLDTARLVVVLAVAMAAIDASLWWLHPEVERYAGLSGLLHAWFAAGATCWMLARARTDGSGGPPFARRAWGAALLVGLVMKLALETRHQAFWLGGAGFTVVTAAHRWGVAAGVACAIVFAVIARDRPPAVAASPAR